MSNAEALRSLAQDMAQAHEDRTKRISEIRKETAEFLGDIGKQNRQRQSDVSGMLAGFAKEDTERAKEIATLLKEFDKQHQAMSVELKSGLARAESERKTQTAAEIRQRQSDVSGMLAGFRRDSAETAAAWKELVATMQAKRGGVAVAPPPVRERKVVEEEAPVAEVLPEAIVEPAPVAEAIEEEAREEKAALEERIVGLIRDRAVGIKLAEIAEDVGEARIKVGNITRMLINESKISKEGLLYFPV